MEFSGNILRGFEKRDKRPKHDFLPTPPHGTHAFINYEGDRLRRLMDAHQCLLWECCCADGQMSDVFRRRGFDMIDTDIRRTRIQPGGVDFLKVREPLSKIVVTNPPYADFPRLFVEHAYTIGIEYIALLLKASFFGSQENNMLLTSRTLRPARIYKMDFRLDFTQRGNPPAAFIWVVWDGWKRRRTETFGMKHPDRFDMRGDAR